MAGKKTGKRLLTWVLVLVMALSLLPLNALAVSNSTVKLHPSANSTVTGVKVKVDDIISGHRVSSISGYDITVDLGKYNVNNDTFRLPYAKDIWKGVDNNKVYYISRAGSGSNRRSEGASALLANGKNTAYYYFKGAPVLPTFTLNYNANGGTDAPASQTHKATSEYEKSHTFTISSQAPTRDGYTFLGWNTNRSATTANYQPGGSIVVTGTTTLYAVWQPKTPSIDEPAKPTENDVTGVVVDIVCVTTTGTHDMVQYPLGHPTDAQHTIGEVVSDGAGGYICPVTVRTAWFVQQASDLVWKVQHTKTASTITFNLTYDKNSETWVKPAANPRIEATHEVTPDTPDDTKPDFENENVNIRVQCVEWPSKHDPYKKSYGILPDAYEDLGMKTVEGTYFYTIKLDRAKYIAQFDEDIRKPHTDTEPNEETYIEWRWENGAWHLIGGPDGVDADIKVKCGQTETPPEAPTADELEKLEMAVQVKCVVDDLQQHKDAYDLLGKYDEDYFVVAPKKDGDDWLCEISYDPDLYVAEFNTAFPNLKHVRNDEKIVPVTLIWADGSWQLKTQGSVHVTEEYTVTFNSYGGTPVPPAQEVEYGLTATKPDDPTLKGYTFAFWYLGDDEQNATAYDFDTPVTGDITLTAKWNINKYTVTFNSYGGTPVPPAQEVEYGLTATKPDDPTLKGHTFAFWYLGEDEQTATAYNFGTPVTENITLTAKWNINKYTVTFDSNGGTPVPPAQKVEYGLTAAEPTSAPTKTGYTFDGWYLGDDEQNATAYDFNTPVTENITLTAKWNINKYTVTFNSYGGTPVPPAQEVEYGLTATEPATAPTKTGYTFDGWYLGDEKYDFSDAVEQNITLYANWEKNIYTVTYTDGVDGEEVFADQTYRVPFEDTTPAFKGTKTRAGYVFAGWKPAFSDTVTGNVTYVAQWKDDKNNNGIADDEEEKYTVTYTDGVANEEVFADQVYGDLLSGTATPAFKGNPTRDGYVFDGWKPAFSDTVTGNVTYVAQWTARTDLSYTVHYYLKNTTKKVADDKTVDGQTFNAVVKEEAIRISGYRVYGDSEKSITIGTGTNEIIFYYTRASRPSASSTSKPTLNTGDHYAYVMGYPDGTVRPNGSITRAEVSTILFRLLSDKTRDEYFTTESSFTDVKAGAWYNNSIATLEKAGVIVDTAKGGAFRPNEAITRAELAAMLAQFSDAKPVKGVKFSDVSAEHWAYEAIAIAAKMGWIEGYPDGTFRPDATITRAEMMTLVNRALERVPSDEDHLLSKRVMLTFPDCKSGDWFYIAVQEATNSHTYERAATEKNGDEQWTALRANRDWTQLEK